MKTISSGIGPIIAIDRKVAKPLHEQIYDAYRAEIVARNLCAGQRVPSTRTLASELGISRIPVLNAYAQLLAEGYFESRVGAGTLVSSSLPDQVAWSKPLRTRSSGHASPRLVSRACLAVSSVERTLPWLGGRFGAFSVGQPALDRFPSQIWSSLVVRHTRKIGPRSFHYGDPMGSKDLREAIAAYLRTARGVRCEAQQIMLVSGSQQALEITTRVLLNAGDSVWMEEPGYRLARGVFVLNGCQLVPVPVDYEGLDVTAGIRRCRKARAALVTPSHQFPLGVTMSASRRLQLLDWAYSSGSWIIEDDYDSEYRYESMPIASLQGLDCNSRVVYVGTFSKVLFPSLRLGYVVIPPDLVERFLAVRVAMDIGPPGFLQGVLVDFINEGHFSRHIRRMRILYQDRRSTLTDCLCEELGFAVTGGQAGMHLFVTLPKSKGTSDQEVAERAARQNLWLMPLSSCYLGEASHQGFILGFGNVAVKQIPHSVRKLRNVLRSK